MNSPLSPPRGDYGSGTCSARAPGGGQGIRTLGEGTSFSFLSKTGFEGQKQVLSHKTSPEGLVHSGPVPAPSAGTSFFLIETHNKTDGKLTYNIENAFLE